MNQITEANINDPKAPHNTALSKAKIQLMASHDSAFFTTLCFSLRHVWDISTPTAKTNGLEIRYNPNFFLSLNVRQQVFLLIHEAMHVAYMHMLRQGTRDHAKWNYACDFVINGQLIDRGFEMPPGGLHDNKYRDMSAEQIYDILPQPPSNSPLLDLGLPSEGPGEEGQEQGQGQPLEEAIQDILVRAQLQSKMAGDKPGTIPGEIEISLNKLLDPKLPWHRLLAKYLNKYAKNDYSWRKPSRRYFPKHYLPALYSEHIMDLVFAVDTSGSVSDEDFNRFISEVAGVLRMMKPEQITLIQFDTEIKAVDKIQHLQDLYKVKFTGRGGTRIESVIEYINQNKSQVLLVFTDGDFHIPSITTKTDLVWLINNNHRFTYPQGKVIHYEIN